MKHETFGESNVFFYLRDQVSFPIVAGSQSFRSLSGSTSTQRPVVPVPVPGCGLTDSEISARIQLFSRVVRGPDWKYVQQPSLATLLFIG